MKTLKYTGVALAVMAFAPLTSSADCILGQKSPEMLCSSYDFNLPVNITNPIGGPSLTVMNGNVGIGLTTPTAQLETLLTIPSGVSSDSTAQRSRVFINASANPSGTISASDNAVFTFPNQMVDIPTAYGVLSSVIHNGSSTIAYAAGLRTAIFNHSTGKLTKAVGLLVPAPINSGGGSIDNFYGIFVDTPTAGTNNYSIYSVGGKNYFGGDLDVAGTIKATTICDENGANCKTISAGWGSGGGGGTGTVTSVGTGTGLLGGPITSSGTLSVDVGTTANKIVQLDGSAALPAVSGANLTNVNATKIGGGTISVSGASSGQVLGFDGTNWSNKSLAVSDIANLSTQLGSKLDASNMPASCSANQTLTFSSPTGMWACSDIVVTPAVFGTQAANMVMASPDGTSGTPTFRKLTLADLPSGIGSGTDSWTVSGSDIYRNTGKVAIGATSAAARLEVKANSSAEVSLIARGNTSDNADLQQWQGNNQDVLTKITKDGYLDLSGTRYLNAFNLILKVNNEVTGLSEVSGGFGNGIYRTSSGRSFVNYISDGPNNSLLSGGVSNENYRRFRMTGGGSIEFGNGVTDMDTIIRRYSSGGVELNTTISSAPVLSITRTSGHTGDLFRLSFPGTSGGNMMKVTAEGKVGIGTTTPGSELDVNGTLRVNQICDRTGANCKDVAGGWSLSDSKAKEILAKMDALMKENAQLKNELKSLNKKVSSLEDQSAIKNPKFAKSR